MPLKEYKPGTTFTGVVGRTHDQSEPAWPEPPRAREGSPNVLFIVLVFSDIVLLSGTFPTLLFARQSGPFSDHS